MYTVTLQLAHSISQNLSTIMGHQNSAQRTNGITTPFNTQGKRTASTVRPLENDSGKSPCHFQEATPKSLTKGEQNYERKKNIQRFWGKNPMIYDKYQMMLSKYARNKTDAKLVHFTTIAK